MTPQTFRVIRPVGDGLEVWLNFALYENGDFHWRTCCGCGDGWWDRVAPVILHDGGEIDYDATGEPKALCRICSYKGAKRLVASWPAMTADEVRRLWREIRQYQLTASLEYPEVEKTGNVVRQVV